MKAGTLAVLRTCVTGLCVLLLLQACSEAPQPPFRIGTNVWPGYEPLYLARSLGYLPEEDYRLVEYSSSSQVLRAYRNGAIDAAGLTLDEVLLLVQDGFSPRVVLVMDISSGADGVVAQTGLDSMQALRGQRVGYEATALGSYMLARALEGSGMTAADIRKIPLEIDDHEQAFRNREVDAVVTFEPVLSRLQQEAGGVLVFDSTEIPGEIVDVLVVREAVLQREPERIRFLLAQWFRALDYFERESDDAASRMSLRLQLPPEQVMAMYDGLLLPGRDRNQELLSPLQDNGSLLPVLHQLSQVMLEERLLKKPVGFMDVFPRSQVH